MTRIRIDASKQDADVMLDILKQFVEHNYLNDEYKDVLLAFSQALDELLKRRENDGTIHYYKQ